MKKPASPFKQTANEKSILNRLEKKELLIRLSVLFWTFFKIALFVVGGGLAMLPVIEEVFHRRYKWLNEKEILDMVVLTQTVPGLIAVNASVYVGAQIAGFIGSITALAGVMLPSLIIVCLIAFFMPDLSPDNPYILQGFSGIRAAVTGIFLITACRLGKEVIHSFFDGCVVFFLIVLLLLGVYPLYVILLSMLTGLFLILIKRKRQTVSVWRKYD